MFKESLKIEINEEQPLDTVISKLVEKGYQRFNHTPKKVGTIIAHKNGMIYCYAHEPSKIEGVEKLTRLTDI